jgi:hypothetical protein
MTSEKDSATFVVATHGHCFDGMCSAALFTRLMRAIGQPGATFSYRACGYGPQQNGVDPAVLTGTDNAILDFRYTATQKLTWYFDHHATAFASEADRAHFEASRDGHKFFEPDYGSCSKLIYDVSRERFQLKDDPNIVELVRWADIIDAARFPSAEMAVKRDEPALQLMTVVENEADDGFLARFVPMLLERPLQEIALHPDVQKSWKPLYATHLAFIDRVRGKSERRGEVIYVDLTDSLTEVVGKFVTYALFPESLYSVVVSRGKTRCKISVGYNPWSGKTRRHDISAICSRYGGGGHAVVGAVALAANDVERAKQIAAEIARELDA